MPKVCPRPAETELPACDPDHWRSGILGLGGQNSPVTALHFHGRGHVVRKPQVSHQLVGSANLFPLPLAQRETRRVSKLPVNELLQNTIATVSHPSAGSLADISGAHTLTQTLASGANFLRSRLTAGLTARASHMLPTFHRLTFSTRGALSLRQSVTRATWPERLGS